MAEDLAQLAPARLVPVMRDAAGIVVGDSMAMAETLAGLSPDEISEGGAGKLLGGGAGKRHWEEFKRRWEERTADASELGDAAGDQQAMQDAFGAAFSRHYSAALRKL